jgi:hypothetical protein
MRRRGRRRRRRRRRKEKAECIYIFDNLRTIVREDRSHVKLGTIQIT